MSSRESTPDDPQPRQKLAVSPGLIVFLIAALAGFLWAYAGAFLIMARHWWDDPQYSHGWLVPIFSLILLWVRRDLLRAAELEPNLWGMVILLGGVGMRLYGARYYFNWIEDISFLPCLFGMCMLLGGWHALRWAWPALAFLVFMVPLPFFLETMLAGKLQRVATTTSVYFIQTIGLPAISEGTEIHLSQPPPLQVAPACCGLGMLLLFFAMSTGIAFVIKRPWLDKGIIFLSAVPIAIIANIIRITLTAILYEFSATDLAHYLIHKWAGFAMMPIALLLLWLELVLLERLFIVERLQPVKLAHGEAETGITGDHTRAATSRKS